jgi:hypothetical protein
MSSIAKRAGALAAVATMAIAGSSVGSAQAALVPAPIPALPLLGHAFPAVPFVGAGPFGSVGPWGQSGAVIGPVIITTAPSVFVNTNNQVTAGGAIAGPQIAG